MCWVSGAEAGGRERGSEGTSESVMVLYFTILDLRLLSHKEAFCLFDIKQKVTANIVTDRGDYFHFLFGYEELM